jgi:WD40 repeat protein
MSTASAAYVPRLDDPSPTHSARVLALQVSANYIVSSSVDYSVRVWSKRDRVLALPPLFGHPKATIKAVEISEELGLVFGGDHRGNIVAWRLSDGERLLVHPAHSDIVLALALDKTTLASTSRDQSAKVWQIQIEMPELCILQLQHNLLGHNQAVLAVQLSSHSIYTSSGNKDLRIWDRLSGTLLKSLECLASAASFQVRHDATGTQLIGAYTDGMVRVYDLDKGVEVACLEGHTGPVCSVKLVDAGLAGSTSEYPRIASASYDGTIRLWARQQGSQFSWEIVDILSFSDAVISPVPTLPQARSTIQEGKNVYRAADIAVCGHYLYCCGEGSHIVVWHL